MEIRHLKLMQAIVEAGSLTRAADILHLSQSALSHQLKELEAELEAPVFQRIGKRLVITQVGERLLNTAQAVLGELGRARSDIRQMVSGERGLLRICTSCYTCYHWLPALLKDFNEQHPGVDVQIVPDATYRPFEALLNGELDIAIVARPQPAGPLHLSPLFEDEFYAICHRRHAWQKRPFIRPGDFEKEHVFIYTPSKEESSLFQKILMPAGVLPQKTTYVPITEAIIEMVRAELGVTVMAYWLAAPYLDDSLVARKITRSGFKRIWNAATIEPLAALPDYYRFFVDLVKRHSQTQLGQCCAV